MDTKSYNDFIVQSVMRSVLYEVSTSPKPGLVDRFNQGAHDDMDFFTFMSSTSALGKGFREIVQKASQSQGNSYKSLLKIIRPIGIEMEKCMFNATKGVNTHKGIIFSLGIVAAVSAKLNAEENKTLDFNAISEKVKIMTQGLSNELNNSQGKKNLTKGEMIYCNYGFKGIRGEVESGFQTVFTAAIPELRKYKKSDMSQNDLFINILLKIMTTCEDSNIISRHNPKTLTEVQELARKFIDSGGMYQDKGIEAIKKMDRYFIERNISPGGSADLLAVSIFLGFIEGIIE